MSSTGGILQTGRRHHLGRTHPPGSCRPLYFTRSSPRSQIGSDHPFGVAPPVRPRLRAPVRPPLDGAPPGQLNGLVESASGARAAGDALLGMLLPFWQIVIGCFVLLVVVAGTARLLRRGRSRMGNAMLVTAALIVGLTVVGLVTSGR
jgi:hypothetical protein